MTSEAAKVAQAGVTREQGQQIRTLASRSRIGSPDALSYLYTRGRD